jgi:cardiolipin synthase
VSLPNLITIGRLLLVPLTVYLLLTGFFAAAFAAFVAAGVSDALDGFIAKRFGLKTELGAHMDPVADKALLVSIYVVLGILGHLPIWLVIAVVSRDFLIVGAVVLAWMLGRPMPMAPLLVSKANTAAQILLAAFVLAEQAFALTLGPLRPILVFGTAGLTIASAYAYVVEWLRHMAAGTAGEP